MCTGCSLVEMKNQKQEKERKNDNIVFFSTHVIQIHTYVNATLINFKRRK